jgi:aminoglycoside phosphotransferase (APT) family kinase protein
MPRPDARPPALSLAWVEQTLGRGARVVGWKRLTGGLTSIVHRLTVERNGRREEYVLRWWVPDSEWEHWIARAVALETAVLTTLEGSDIPAPRVIGSTTDAALAGPAVLMTRLPGKVHLMPRDRERWLRQMAQMLARIHALALDGKPFESWLDRSQLSPPPDASRADVWREAIALVAEARAPTRTCFLHRDYQHFNMLWSRERLTGVVDWSEACIGPPEVDVGASTSPSSSRRVSPTAFVRYTKPNRGTGSTRGGTFTRSCRMGLRGRSSFRSRSTAARRSTSTG